jgi:ketosteroid isomerase-like protein
MLATTIFVDAQGPCTEAVVKQGSLQMAEDAFSYMPPFGKPVSGKTAIQDTAEKKFGGRTNIKHSWEPDRRIVASTSGDMAYEHGTVDMSYEEDGKPYQFKAVMLNVYKAKDGACKRVAGHHAATGRRPALTARCPTCAAVLTYSI